MAEDEVEQLVDHYYRTDSNRTRGHYKGSLRRFLSEAKPGDLIAIKVNREKLLIYGELSRGPVKELPNHPGVKGRPMRTLKRAEIETLLKNRLPPSVLKYRGTMCLYSDSIDLPAPAEIRSEGLDPAPSQVPDLGSVIKFIRVGADGGAGGRLSRLFPNGYYHFIPIPKHNDPEFCRFTYGSGCNAIRDFSLMHLRRGDVLVFYAGFRPDKKTTGEPLMTGGDQVGIFSYYTIERAFLVDYDEKSKTGKSGLAIEFSDSPRKARFLTGKFDLTPEFRQLASNATFEEVLDDYKDYNPHINEEGSDRTILICGRKHPESRLLAKVEFLASLKSGAYIIMPAQAKKWGLKENADLTRCSLRTVERSATKSVMERLRALP